MKKTKSNEYNDLLKLKNKYVLLASSFQLQRMPIESQVYYVLSAKIHQTLAEKFPATRSPAWDLIMAGHCFLSGHEYIETNLIIEKLKKNYSHEITEDDEFKELVTSFNETNQEHGTFKLNFIPLKEDNDKPLDDYLNSSKSDEIFDPNLPLPITMRAYALARKYDLNKDFVGSAHYFHLSTLLQEDSTNIRLLYSDSLKKNSKFQEALDELKKIKGEDFRKYALTAMYLKYLDAPPTHIVKNSKRAIDLSFEQKEIAMKYSSVLSLAYLSLGQAYEDQHNEQKAFDLYLKAPGSHKDRLLFMTAAGIIALRNSDIAFVLNFVLPLLPEYPSHDRASFIYSRILVADAFFLLNRWDQAIKYYRESLTSLKQLSRRDSDNLIHKIGKRIFKLEAIDQYNQKMFLKNKPKNLLSRHLSFFNVASTELSAVA